MPRRSPCRPRRDPPPGARCSTNSGCSLLASARCASPSAALPCRRSHTPKRKCAWASAISGVTRGRFRRASSASSACLPVSTQSRTASRYAERAASRAAWCSGASVRVRAIHQAEMIGGAGILRRPNDAPGLIDPYRLRHVHHAVEVRDAMLGIDQAPVFRRRLFDPLPRVFAAAAFLRYRHDHELFRRQAVEQLLPHGQVKATASPGGPGTEEHLLPPQRRQSVRHTREVG